MKRIIFYLKKLIRSEHLSLSDKIRSLIRYFCNHIGLNNQRKVINWVSGLKYYYKKGDASFSDNYYFQISDYSESMFLIRYVDNSDLFLDVGANHGHYSLLLAGIKDVHCLAIEPVKLAYENLFDNVKLNNLEELIELRNIGLGKVSGILYFSNDLGTMNKVVGREYEAKEEVQVKTIDSLNILPTIMKVDVEGFEFDVLNGGLETLKNPSLNVLICEINDTVKVDKSNIDLFNLILSIGFRPYEYVNDILYEIESYNKKGHNTIFVKDINLVKNRKINVYK